MQRCVCITPGAISRAEERHGLCIEPARVSDSEIIIPCIQSLYQLDIQKQCHEESEWLEHKTSARHKLISVRSQWHAPYVAKSNKWYCYFRILQPALVSPGMPGFSTLPLPAFGSPVIEHIQVVRARGERAQLLRRLEDQNRQLHLAFPEIIHGPLRAGLGGPMRGHGSSRAEKMS